MNQKRTSYSIEEWMMVASLAGIWGSSFILMKRGLESFSPIQVAAIRMSSAFLFLSPFVLWRIREVPRDKWKFLVASALFGNGIPAFLFTFAQTKISSSVAGILNSLTPLFALLVAYLIFKNKIARIHIIGVLIGFAGAVTIMIYRPNGTFDVNYSYAGLIIIATAMYGLSVNIIKNYLRDMPPLLISGFALMISGVPYGIYLFTTDFTQKLNSEPGAAQSLGFVLILGIVGTSISLLLFNRLIKTTSVLFASSVTYLIPVVAMCWGFFDHEDLGFKQVLGLGAILCGVYLVNRH